MLERLRDEKTRERISREMSSGSDGWPNYFAIDWNDIQIASVQSEVNRRWVGRRVAEVARDRGCTGVEACIDLLIEEQAGIGMINFIMDEDEMRGVLRHPLSVIGSDGSAQSAERAEGQPHPRSYGCLPRVLGRYVRQEELFTLETAVHKMTGMTAAQLGLARRGLLKPGYAADIVVFDANTVADRATFEDPHQYPVGIRAVLVNGKVVVEDGEHLGIRPGKVLPPERG